MAQWSLHNAFESGTLDPILFSEISKKEFGIPAVEYVNSFYKNKGNDESFWINMKDRSDALAVQNLLIMVDDEGDLGGEDNQLRQKAVEDHYQWIHAAKIMGFTSAQERLMRLPHIEVQTIDGADHFFRDLYADDLVEQVLQWLP